MAQVLRHALREIPEISDAKRMTGDLDYVVRVHVADVPTYDRFYQRLIDKVQIADVSASFVMEDIKEKSVLAIWAKTNHLTYYCLLELRAILQRMTSLEASKLRLKQENRKVSRFSCLLKSH